MDINIYMLEAWYVKLWGILGQMVKYEHFMSLTLKSTLQIHLSPQSFKVTGSKVVLSLLFTVCDEKALMFQLKYELYPSKPI